MSHSCDSSGSYHGAARAARHALVFPATCKVDPSAHKPMCALCQDGRYYQTLAKFRAHSIVEKHGIAHDFVRQSRDGNRPITDLHFALGSNFLSRPRHLSSELRTWDLLWGFETHELAN